MLIVLLLICDYKIVLFETNLNMIKIFTLISIYTDLSYYTIMALKCKVLAEILNHRDQIIDIHFTPRNLQILNIKKKLT